MKIAVWDLPTRSLHWALVVAVTGAYFTSEDEWLLEYHALFGYVALGLVLLRVIWGFAGNGHARFSGFLTGFGPVREYLSQAARLKPRRFLGHNPAVGWVIVIKLAYMVVLAVLGMAAYGGEEGLGVLGSYVSFDAGTAAHEAHEVLAYAFVAVIVVHVSAALFHDFILKENIVIAMFTGEKDDAGSWAEKISHPHPGDGMTKGKLAFWLAAALLGGLGLAYLPPDDARKYFSEAEPPAIIKSEAGLRGVPVMPIFKEECAASCHIVFHPTLLPADSWRRVMAGLDDHFGENVELDAEATSEILEYLVEFSAEKSVSEASRKIVKSLGRGEPLVRITDAPYWRRKHSELGPEIYARESVKNKANCLACHPGAEVGSFEDKDIRLPE
jgi:cytochrome b